MTADKLIADAVALADEYQPHHPMGQSIRALAAEVARQKNVIASLEQELELRGELVAEEVARLERESGECPFCGHEWSRHDPEDGECDAHTSELHRFGVCQCGRDLGWMQEKIAKLSTAALSQADRGERRTHGRGCACTPCRAEDWDAIEARLQADRGDG